MKILTSLLLFACILLQPVGASPSQDKEAIHSCIKEMFRLRQEGDFDNFAKLLAPDYQYINTNPPYTHNRAETLTAEKNAYENFSKNKAKGKITTTISTIKMGSDGDYQLTLKLENKQVVNGKPFTARFTKTMIWTRSENSWLCRQEKN